MTLRLSYFVPPPALVAAHERGLLDDVDLIETRTTGSAAQLTGLLEGSLDVVVTAIDNLFEWTRAGADVRLVAQVEATTPLAIFTRPEVDSLEGLAGGRFAVDAFDNGFALVARYLLGQAGVQVDYIEVGGVKERLDALLAGEVTGTLLGPPFDGVARGAGMRELVTVQQAFPDFPGQGLVVRAAVVDLPETEALLAALRQGGLLPVEPAGIDLLTDIRDSLGLLAPGADVGALRA